MGETVKMPDWPKLWEREPGLCPEHLTLDHSSAPWAAALCRDAAVRFILANGGVIHGGYPASVSYEGRRCGSIAVNDDGTGTSSVDSTLFIACQAIVEGRPL